MVVSLSFSSQSESIESKRSPLCNLRIPSWPCRFPFRYRFKERLKIYIVSILITTREILYCVGINYNSEKFKIANI